MAPAWRGVGRAFLSRLAKAISDWRQSAADGNRLADLSDYYLKDIGLSRGDEVRDPRELFWRR